VKVGVDAGLALLHNSVSDGKWAGRFLRKDILYDLAEAVDKQAAEKKSQLLYLRKWAFKIYPFSNDADEIKLDDFLNFAQRYTKTHNSDMGGFRDACVNVEVYVWSKSHPAITSDAAKDLFADFKALLRWLRDHSTTVGDEEGLGALLDSAVKSIAAGDRKAYGSRRAMIKETVYNAEFRD
jgi:hypothetical protein